MPVTPNTAEVSDVSLPERCTRHRVFGTANLKAFINLIYGESLFVFRKKKIDIPLYKNITNCIFDTAFALLTLPLTLWTHEVYQTLENYKNVFEYTLEVYPNTDRASISSSNSFFLSLSSPLLLPPGQL